jgi:hypothetical protein
MSKFQKLSNDNRYSDSSLVKPSFVYARAAYAPEIVDPRSSEIAALATIPIHTDPYLVESHLSIAFVLGLSQSPLSDAICWTHTKGYVNRRNCSI